MSAYSYLLFNHKINCSLRFQFKTLTVLILLLCTKSLQAQESDATASKTTKPKWKLLWADEFNYQGLPDSTIWGYEVGYIRNKESQYYTYRRSENVRVENGTLIIESRKEEYKDFHYTSGSINTLDKRSFVGDFRVEICAKLPEGKGIWPAIWMMGTNRKQLGWPLCSELDIMEFVGHTPNTVYATMHWADSTINLATKSRGEKTTNSDLHNTYHIYALERVGNMIYAYFDDLCYLEFEVPNTAYAGSFVSPLYLLINTAIGGSWGGAIDDSIMPQKFIVDYVRVYRPKSKGFFSKKSK